MSYYHPSRPPAPARPPVVIHTNNSTANYVVGLLLFFLALGSVGAYIYYRQMHPEIAVAQQPSLDAQPRTPNREMKAVEIAPEKDGERGIPEYNESAESLIDSVEKMTDDIDREPTPKEMAENAKANAVVKPVAGSDGLGIKGDQHKNVIRKTMKNPDLSAKELAALKKLPPNRIVDVLVVYSVSSKYRYGGIQGNFSRAQWYVRGANEYYKSRGVNGMLRLVGVVSADYIDTERVADLRVLSRGGVRCGRESIEDLRRITGADIVCLFGTKGGGGVAHCPGQFCIVKRGNSRQNPTVFAHELQHTFGWKHGHAENLWQVEAAFPRSAGHRPATIPLDQIYIQYRESDSDTMRKHKWKNM